MALAAECYMPALGCEALYPGAAAGAGAATGARLPHHTPPQLATQPQPKDYSIPLHVDCSVEYELPDCAKPPQGVKIEPLLMIHPAHFRRLDSLRRCPFVNNLPTASGGRAYELPPPAPIAESPACVAKPARARQPAKVKESPEAKRWTHVGKTHCCKGVVQYGVAQAYRLPEVPEPYWGTCGGALAGAGVAAPDPFAPKEGDTLENSSFGKWPQQRYRSARHKPHQHPYALEPPAPASHTQLGHNCDKTLDMLQGNRLVSPFHAKMFSGESMYQNYPIVMYK